MPKVHIRGEREPLEVSQEEAMRIMTQKNDPKYKSNIMVMNRSLPKGKIGEITFGSESNLKKVDLNNPADRQAVKEFERMLDDRAKHAELAMPLEHYGQPYDEFLKLHPEHLPRPGFVFNDLLGLVHWSVVQYAVEQHLITRLPYGTWAIKSNGIGDRVDVLAFVDFQSKLRALGDLRGRRIYAEGKSQQAYEDITEAKQDLITKVEMPKEEVQLPF